MRRHQPKPYWHMYHDEFMSFSTEPIKNRREYIRRYKSALERPLRLKLLKRVKGKLPMAVIRTGVAYADACEARCKAKIVYADAWAGDNKAGAAYVETAAAYNKARPPRDKALAAHYKARGAYDKALAVRDQAWAVYHKALRICYKTEMAYKKAIEENLSAIERLHKKECPDCPWDGETIFPNKED